MLKGKISNEINPKNVKFALDHLYKSDNRHHYVQYIWLSMFLLKIGFQNMNQVLECISGYDDDKVSRIINNGNRQGQINRFMNLIKVGLGYNIKKIAHQVVQEPDSWCYYWYIQFAKLNANGIKVKNYVI